MIQLQEKARWLRPSGGSLPRGATRPRKKADHAQPRPISSIVQDYKDTIDKLEKVEAELYDWLTAPAPQPSLQESATGAERPADPRGEAPDPEGPKPAKSHPPPWDSYLDELVEVDVVH